MTTSAPHTVFTFRHLGQTYRIVTTATFPWRKAFGFKPKWPYVLCDSKGYGLNGVSQQQLDDFYKVKYAQETGETPDGRINE